MASGSSACATSRAIRAGWIGRSVFIASSHLWALPRTHRGELLDPRFVTIDFDPACSRDRLAQKLAAVCHDTKVDITAAANLLWFDIDLYNACVCRDDAVAPAGRQPNTRAEQDDKVSAFSATPRMGGRMNRAERAET